LVLPPAGALRLRRVLEPTVAGLAALAAGQRGAEALERYRGGAPAAADADRLRRRGWRRRIVCTSPASVRRHACSRWGGARRAARDAPAGGVRLRPPPPTVDEATLRQTTGLRPVVLPGCWVTTCCG